MSSLAGTSIEFLHKLQLEKLIALTRPVHFVDGACALAALYALVKAIHIARRRLKTTSLRGPASPSFVFGVGKKLVPATEAAVQYEAWAEEYGAVYEIPSTLGQRRIVLCDPRAIAHFYARETWTYVLTPFDMIVTEIIVGKGLLWAQGESHQRRVSHSVFHARGSTHDMYRQRKALTPAFSNAAIRRLTSVFYDSAYKAKGIWDSIIESTDGDSAIIEVQTWMSHISLDTIGIAGFSHDFGSLDGKPTSVTEIFDSFGKSKRSALNTSIFLLAQSIPILAKTPTSRSKLVKKLNKSVGEITDVLLARTRKEKEAGVIGDKDEKSIIGLLIKAESEDAELHLSPEEVRAQAKVLLLAGYETMSISLTWALIEIALKPEVQTKLREELLEFGADPTYDQLSSSLPYLDAVVHEILRLHPPVPEFRRVAAEDDVVPLSEPIRTKSGQLVDHISVAKGSNLVISIACVNRSAAIWGSDAKEFKPERWLDEEGIPRKAKEIQGHRHLLTFVDGPRTCLGKGFAIAEFKTVLLVLVKNFVFEMRDGPETKIETGRGVLPRPKVAGEEGARVPLRVRRFE
ncbi:hypothetical protein HYDPIDRAFT_140642 [Hydnomerulius pinastri MD-312]|uniref:Cytochrome P450 n=1 Tax=Hydnomerulius pinastri MD-312 TaxID=994086 RepID=A0A0C9V2D0_9AGAM|nr:hypothetical protein HYDPIDRAFT_140642 [Hydnomerulius pinastri MD-312]